jgi:hypothetical protein
MQDPKTEFIRALGNVSLRVSGCGELRLGQISHSASSLDAMTPEQRRAHTHIVDNHQWYYTAIQESLAATNTVVVRISELNVVNVDSAFAGAASLFVRFTEWALEAAKKSTVRSLQRPDHMSAADAGITQHHVDQVCVPWLTEIMDQQLMFTVNGERCSYFVRDLTDLGMARFVGLGSPLVIAADKADLIAAYAHTHQASLLPQLVQGVKLPPCAWQSVVIRLLGARALHVSRLLMATARNQERVCDAICRTVQRDYDVAPCGKGLTLAGAAQDSAHVIGVTVTNACVRRIGELLREQVGGTSRRAYVRRDWNRAKGGSFGVLLVAALQTAADNVPNADGERDRLLAATTLTLRGFDDGSYHPTSVGELLSELARKVCTAEARVKRKRAWKDEDTGRAGAGAEGTPKNKAV